MGTALGQMKMPDAAVGNNKSPLLFDHVRPARDLASLPQNTAEDRQLGAIRAPKVQFPNLLSGQENGPRM